MMRFQAVMLWILGKTNRKLNSKLSSPADALTPASVTAKQASWIRFVGVSKYLQGKRRIPFVLCVPPQERAARPIEAMGACKNKITFCKP